VKDLGDEFYIITLEAFGMVWSDSEMCGIIYPYQNAAQRIAGWDITQEKRRLVASYLCGWRLQSGLDLS
jgi:hypothetical protein